MTNNYGLEYEHKHNGKKRLGADVEIKGNIKFCGRTSLEGKLDGEIQTDGFVARRTRHRPTATSHARDPSWLRRQGQGNINAKEKIDIKAKGRGVR